MRKITIQTLGGFHLLVDNVCVDAQLNRSPKGTILIQRLLLAGGRTVSSVELIQILELNNMGALKTLVSRTRSLMAQIEPGFEQAIVTVPGGYHWQEREEIEVDYVKFSRAASGLHECRELSGTAEESFDLVMDMYRGDLLAEHAHREWVIGATMTYRAVYLAVVQRFLNLLERADRQSDLLRVCRQALELLPFNEPLRLRLSDIMTKQGLPDFEVPEQVVKTHLVHMGARMDENLDKLKADVAVIGPRRAMVCDGDLFRDACRLTVRNLERMGAVVCLTMVMVSMPKVENDEEHAAIELDLVMDELTTLMASSLRRGDVVCRIAVNQVAALLPAAPEHTASLILERIIRVFYQDRSMDDVLLTYRAIML